VENTQDREIFEEEADIVVQARGNLNDKAWPTIPGLNIFKGEIMHSAAWNQDYDFKNKRVGVIGGGSSSIQIVPTLQKVEGLTLTCFVRSKTWISNPFGDESMKKLGLDPKKLECR
jgi:cation diffusion facilitator CzcD-associated flavoprotein CzcO